MSLTLSDALSQFRSITDTAHKFWGYFQAVAGGTAAFAWLQEAPVDIEMFVFLSIAFAAFAVLNLRLIVTAQAEAVAAANCIKSYSATLGAAVPPELQPIIHKLDPDSARNVGVWHATLSLATLIAVWWRYGLLAC